MISAAELKLPARKRNKKESKAPALYARYGRTNMADAPQRTALPVSLDPEAMEQLVRELAMKEHQENLEQTMQELSANIRLPETQALPGPQF